MTHEAENNKSNDNILRLLRPRRQVRGGDDPIAGAETRLADEFVATFADEIVYVPEWRRWMLWVGTHWQEDKMNRARHIVREICERNAEEKEDKSLASARTIAAVESIAKVDLSIAARADEWDIDRYRLNTPGGTVDLRTGHLEPHDPAHCITKITAAAPGGHCLTWLAFLDRVTKGDPDLKTFLQRMAGYALTGETKEHALFFLHGTGGNGKSIFLDSLSAVMGDYAKTSAIETFTASKTDRHPTELAALRGARLVTAIETEKGRNWAESKIKALTGGDTISARRMRQDFFEYKPQFKLVIAGNHMPGLQSVDEAIKRRFHLVPFSVTIPVEERDPNLSEKLRAEWPGILRWAIDGALAWQLTGLQLPAAVRHATAEYIAAEDTLSRWLEDCCIRNVNAFTPVDALFRSWERWTKSEGEPTGTKKAFSQALKARGFKDAHRRRQRGYIGLVLVPEGEAPPHWSDRNG